MRTDDLVSILTHAAAVSQSAPGWRKPLRRFLRSIRPPGMLDRPGLGSAVPWARIGRSLSSHTSIRPVLFGLKDLIRKL